MQKQSPDSASNQVLQPPAYFEPIRSRAAADWDQLEANERLFRMASTLFDIVRAPRFVISELLQNADDANAQTVRIILDETLFVFRHNGDDFTEANLSSLCSFAFSDKRSLHLIGSRGIGFKSTFSLSESVELRTSSLAVEFQRGRFYEPRWMSGLAPIEETEIHIVVESEPLVSELRSNIRDWSKSAVSMLFFRHIDTIHFDNITVKRTKLGPGPVTRSERVTLSDHETEFLLISSEDEAFPETCLEEVREQRDSKLDLPPCSVSIVIGTQTARLYTVLPTEVTLSLPFSCNAPFLQDPSRTGIDQPSKSETNRWLLQRIGKLAADSMLTWLSNNEIPADKRAKAYSLLPQLVSEDLGLGGKSRSLILESFLKLCEGKELVLCRCGKLETPSEAIAVPAGIFEIWTEAQVRSLLNRPNAKFVSDFIPQKFRNVLAGHSWIAQCSWKEILEALQSDAPVPKPDSWPQLLKLWDRVTEHRNRWGSLSNYHIVPVQHGSLLVSPATAVRLAKTGKLHNPNDWELISKCVQAVDPDLLTFLSPTEHPDMESQKLHENAISLLKLMSLDRASTWDKVMGLVADSLPKTKDTQETRGQRIRITHLMAAVNSQIPAGFSLEMFDGRLCADKQKIIADESSPLFDICRDQWVTSFRLSGDYHHTFTSCSEEQWKQWVGKRDFATCPIFRKSRYGRYRSRSSFLDFLKPRISDAQLAEPYKGGHQYLLNDNSFKQELVTDWESLSANDDMCWVRVVRAIMNLSATDLTKTAHAEAYMESDNGHGKFVTGNPIPADWVMYLRGKKCLLDTDGTPCQPDELLMRNPATDALQGVDRFIASEFDTPQNQVLLKLLGVNEKPSNADGVLSRLRALAACEEPILPEIRKRFELLGKLLRGMAADEVGKVADVFATEKLILSSDSPAEWKTAGEIFRFGAEDGLTGLPTVHSFLSDLDLWWRLGVEEKPTKDRLIEWLKTLPNGETLGKRKSLVRRLCSEIPDRIWNKCQTWISLAGTWTVVSSLEYSTADISSFSVTGLFPAIKSNTADFTMLNGDVVGRGPFSDFPRLETEIEYRLSESDADTFQQRQEPWLQNIASYMVRIDLQNEEQTETVRSVGRRLQSTTWQPFTQLAMTPYLKSTPVGQAVSPDVYWLNQTLFVRELPFPEIIGDLSANLTAGLHSSKVAEAIRFCAARDEHFIRSYMEHNFKFADSMPAVPEATSHVLEAAAIEDPGVFLPIDQESTAAEPESKTTSDVEDAPQATDSDPTTASGPERPQALPSNQSSNPSPNSVAPAAHKPELPAPSGGTSFVTRYAVSRGFRKELDSKTFQHKNGRRLVKAESPFHWMLVEADGTCGARFWISESRLSAGVVVAAELWESVKADAENCVLVLADRRGAPKEYTGMQLVQLAKTDSIEVYPAQYRLRQDESAGGAG